MFSQLYERNMLSQGVYFDKLVYPWIHFCFFSIRFSFFLLAYIHILRLLFVNFLDLLYIKVYFAWV